MSIDDFVDHLYTYLYVYMLVSGIMARLYWRIKQAGRWTWTPADVLGDIDGVTHVIPYQEEEE